MKKIKFIELFLRISLAAGLLSAVADRLGIWDKAHSAWGNWANFVNYTSQINPLIPHSLIPILAYVSTFLEIIFGICLLINFKTILIAQATGLLLLLFALAMTFSIGIKAPLDYSVYCASAAAFSLSIIIKQNKN